MFLATMKRSWKSQCTIIMYSSAFDGAIFIEFLFCTCIGTFLRPSEVRHSKGISNTIPRRLFFPKVQCVAQERGVVHYSLIRFTIPHDCPFIVHVLFRPSLTFERCSDGRALSLILFVNGIMVVFLDLDEHNVPNDPHADPHEPAGLKHYRWPPHQPEHSTTTATCATLDGKAAEALAPGERLNPNINGCSAALACYPCV